MAMRTWQRLRHVLSASSLLVLMACVNTPVAPNAPLTAQTAAPSPVLAVTPQIQKALAPTGVLRVGVYPGSPTSWVRNPSTGEPTGVAFELGQALGKTLGVPVQVIEFARVAEVIAALKASQVDVTFTNATPARAKDLAFTQPLIQLELGLLVPTASSIRQFADVDRDGVRVGVSQGSSSQGVLTQRLTNARVVSVPSLSVAQQMLTSGELNAFATNKGILFELSQQLPGFQVLPDRWGLENLALAIPKSHSAGMPFLQAFAQDAALSGLLQQITQRAGLRGMAPAN